MLANKRKKLESTCEERTVSHVAPSLQIATRLTV